MEEWAVPSASVPPDLPALLSHLASLSCRLGHWSPGQGSHHTLLHTHSKT